jgi:alginate O-acetyltransferase complex protein AlgI
MLFNSFEFAIFLPIVFCVYWSVPSRKIQSKNIVLLISSYLFYSFWDWRFLSLILISSVIDYTVGIAIYKEKRTSVRKLLLAISIITNIGLLGFFKYFNFFAENIIHTFTLFGCQVFSPNIINVVLPVGISFYTFQTLSYTIDIYRKKVEHKYNIIEFFAYVSFFPQLVAGPIERASNLLPQFRHARKFSYNEAIEGLRQILWGLFKKIAIADNCGFYVNEIFSSSNEYSASTLLMGLILFSFQIYGDFSGYSDIAIGTSRLFGFTLKMNFNHPYFSRDIAEFWRRWHISLTTWFRDYVYIPLGGSRGKTINKVRNVFLIFIISGFWHGANWTFVVWGALNALYLLPLMFTKKNRHHLNVVAEGKLLPSPQEALSMLLTFLLISTSWVFFRSPSIDHSFSYLLGIYDLSLFSLPDPFPFKIILLILMFITVEWFNRTKSNPFQGMHRTTTIYIRWLLYYICILTIYIYRVKTQEFIYFQF